MEQQVSTVTTVSDNFQEKSDDKSTEQIKRAIDTNEIQDKEDDFHPITNHVVDSMEEQVSGGAGTRTQKKRKLEEKFIENDRDDISAENADGNDDFPSNNEIHPLINPVILTRLFELCPAKLLAKFRLVSRQWYQLSLTSWRSTVAIKFQHDHLIDTGRDFFWKSDNSAATSQSSTIQRFLDYVKEPTHEHSLKPFRKFQLDGWEFTKSDYQTQQFVKFCGPFITNLELSRCTFNDISAVRDVLFKRFPKLNKLILTEIQCKWSFTAPVEPKRFIEPKYGAHENLKRLDINEMEMKELPISCLELLSHYPSLEKLKLYELGKKDAVSILNAIKVIRGREPRKLQIRDLDIFEHTFDWKHQITPEICLLLRDAQLPLEVLSIDFGSNTESAKVQEILEWHATLKKLVADHHPAYIDYVSCQNFPFGVQLDNLQELVITEYLCRSLNFMKFVPNLRKLHISEREDLFSVRSYAYSCTDIVQNIDTQIIRDVKLKKCIDFAFGFSISEEETRVLMNLLPNLEKVVMPMTTGQFRMACQNWSNLRELEVLGDFLDDDAITGFSTEDVVAINKAEKKGCSPAVTCIRIHPNIADLKHLQKFTMDQYELKQPYCTVFHGFLMLPYLQSLHIWTNLDDSAKGTIREKISDITFTG